MIQNERDIRHEQVLRGVRQMMTAARTAPKAKGIDIIEMALVADAELIQLADKLESMGKESGKESFLRDSDNIRHAEAVMIIGTRQQTMGLNCAYCGSPTCFSKPEAMPCAINSIDLGIARFGMCDSRRFASGYACDVQRRISRPASGMAWRKQIADSYSGQRLVKEPVFRPQDSSFKVMIFQTA